MIRLCFKYEQTFNQISCLRFGPALMKYLNASILVVQTTELINLVKLIPFSITFCVNFFVMFEKLMQKVLGAKFWNLFLLADIFHPGLIHYKNVQFVTLLDAKKLKIKKFNLIASCLVYPLWYRYSQLFELLMFENWNS